MGVVVGVVDGVVEVGVVEVGESFDVGGVIDTGGTETGLEEEEKELE